MVTGVMDHRVLGNRSHSYLAMEQLGEALRDAELCCKLQPCWAKGPYNTGGKAKGWVTVCVCASVCVCHDSRSNGLLLCAPRYPYSRSCFVMLGENRHMGMTSNNIISFQELDTMTHHQIS